MGKAPIASGFKGPADLCAFPNARGLMVVVPDLVKGELRMITARELARYLRVSRIATIAPITAPAAAAAPAEW